jgi:2-dehydropantoate 2-reductase
MRLVIYGAGAVGSVIGGRAVQGGADVVLVARPAHAQAITEHGLLLRTGEGEDRINVAAVTAITDLDAGPNDVVIITSKTQDTPPIHQELRRWNPSAAVVCGTNGVEHERVALRLFDRVYGMVIQLPATFEKPGEVTALCLPTNAILDVGRYPGGIDDTAIELAALLNASPHVLCEADPDVMVKKYGKILLNLGNAAEAACGPVGRGSEIVRRAQAEAKTIYAAAGITHEVADSAASAAYKERVATMGFSIPAGQTFLGGSTWQSLAKGATSLETDYFNGEIVLLARLHGVPAPANRFLQDLAFDLLASGAAPESMSLEELESRGAAALADEPR